MADIGARISQRIVAGEEVDDDLQIELVNLALHSVADGRGWIIDGFPTTVNQAYELRRFLLGVETRPPSPEYIIRDGKPGDILRPVIIDPFEASRLDPQPGMHAVVEFAVNNVIVLDRALGRRSVPATGDVIHLSKVEVDIDGENPIVKLGPSLPPQGAKFGEIEQIEDVNFAEAQLQSRISFTELNMAALKKYYGHRVPIKSMDASGSIDETYHALEKLLHDASQAEVRERFVAEEAIRKANSEAAL